MAKKKRQKYVRIVKTKNNKWVFRTELGVVIATFLASFAFLSMKFSGNAVADTVGQGVSVAGAVLFVLGVVELFTLIASRRKK